MKEAVAVLFLCLLVQLGWNQPYSEHFARIAGLPEQQQKLARGRAPHSPAAATSTATVAADRDRSWMWSATKMDAPYDRKEIR